jgi:predicted nucleic acid-binding protein
MNDVKAFVDTNVIVYLYSDVDSIKQKHAFWALSQYDCQISTQVINEFNNVCIRKWKAPKEDILSAIKIICSYCDVVYIYGDTIEEALDVREKYGYSYYDSLMIASALEHDCSYLLTEDMADGQLIERRLTIRNIFADENF